MTISYNIIPGTTGEVQTDRAKAKEILVLEGYERLC